MGKKALSLAEFQTKAAAATFPTGTGGLVPIPSGPAKDKVIPQGYQLGDVVAPTMATPYLDATNATHTNLTATNSTVGHEMASTITLTGTTANADLATAVNLAGPTRPAATYQITDPAGTTSGAGVMMGIGVGHQMTPLVTGRIMMTICGMAKSTGAVVGQGVEAWLYTGTGTPPVNGAAITGTNLSSTLGYHQALGSNGTGPFALTGLLTGATINVARWFDIVVAVIVGATASVTDMTMTLVEV